MHRLAEIIRFRMLMIAAGYEDGNDADALRGDPMFKLALDRLPSDEELFSQSTISRLEKLPTLGTVAPRRALIEQSCGSFRQVPSESSSISTIPLTACMASSSCACSTPIMMITASNRLSSSTARDGS